jgi:hypothetical protein
LVEKSDSGGTTREANSFSIFGEERKRSRIWLGSKYIRASCMKMVEVEGRVVELTGYRVVSAAVRR